MKSSKVNKSFTSSQARNMCQLSEIDMIQMQIKKYTKEIENQRKIQGELNTMICDLKEKVNTQIGQVNQQKKMLETDKNRKAASNMVTLKKQAVHYEKLADNLLSDINKIKQDIDYLRKEKQLLFQSKEQMAMDIEATDKQIKDMDVEYEKIKEINSETQQQIIDLKLKSDMNQKQYQSQLNNLKQQVEQNDNEFDKLQNTLSVKQTSDTIDSVDTLTVLKRRVQGKIIQNQERLKVLVQYTYNMQLIDGILNQIKSTTNTEIDEIENNLIKSEKQNMELLTYIEYLDQQIEQLENQNRELDQKISAYRDQIVKNNNNANKNSTLSPAQLKAENKISKKHLVVTEFQSLLNKIQPQFEQLLLILSRSKLNKKYKNKTQEYETAVILNENTLESYLQDLDNFVQDFFQYKISQNPNLDNSVSQYLLLDEMPTKDFQKKAVHDIPIHLDEPTNEQKEMLNQKKLKQIAAEYIQKIKAQIASGGHQQKSAKKQQPQPQAHIE